MDFYEILLIELVAGAEFVELTTKTEVSSIKGSVESDEKIMPVDRSGLHVYEKLRQAVFATDVSEFITKPSLIVKVFEIVVFETIFVFPAK